MVRRELFTEGAEEGDSETAVMLIPPRGKLILLLLYLNKFKPTLILTIFIKIEY